MTVVSHLPMLLADRPPPYHPTGEAKESLDDLLSWLAYGASAAGVLGIIIVGTNMALQLRHGEMGEGASHFRGFFIVMIASVLATTAAPLVQWFGPFTP